MKKPLATLLSGLIWMPLMMLSGRADAVQLGDEVVRQKVSAFVNQQLATYVKAGENGSSIAVEVSQAPCAPFDFPDAEKISDIRITLKSALTTEYTDRLVVRVSLASPGGEHRDIGVPVKITVNRPVWVVKHPVASGAHLRPSDFELQVRDVSQDLAHVAGPELNMNNYIARVNLASGQMLDTRRIQLPPDVRRNDDVLIVLTNGRGMDISVMGEAMTDANIGDTVRVRHGEARTRKYYTATVVGKNRVQVEI